jgi:hypothetical protein
MSQNVIGKTATKHALDYRCRQKKYLLAKTKLVKNILRDLELDSLIFVN